MFISVNFNFIFRAMDNLMEFTPHREEHGCVGVTYILYHTKVHNLVIF